MSSRMIFILSRTKMILSAQKGKAFKYEFRCFQLGVFETRVIDGSGESLAWAACVSYNESHHHKKKLNGQSFCQIQTDSNVILQWWKKAKNVKTKHWLSSCLWFCKKFGFFVKTCLRCLPSGDSYFFCLNLTISTRLTTGL